jgi:hypothetical protein
MARKMKSAAVLRQRIVLLQQRGADPSLHGNKAVGQVVDVVGDLSLYEVYRLVRLAESDHNGCIIEGGSPTLLN